MLETFAIVEQPGQQGLSLRLQLLADGGTPDQLLVLLKHLQQLVHTQKQHMDCITDLRPPADSALGLKRSRQELLATCCGLSCTSPM